MVSCLGIDRLYTSMKFNLMNFQKNIDFYINQKFYRQSLWGHCSRELMNLPAWTILGLIENDLKENSLLAKNKKIKFWINVMNVYRQQYEECFDAVYLPPMKAIFSALPDPNVEGRFKEQYEACEQTIIQSANRQREVSKAVQVFNSISEGNLAKFSQFVTKDIIAAAYDSNKLKYWVSVLAEWLCPSQASTISEEGLLRAQAVFIALQPEMEDETIPTGIKQRYEACAAGIQKSLTSSSVSPSVMISHTEEKKEEVAVVANIDKLKNLFQARDNINILYSMMRELPFAKQKAYLGNKVRNKDLIQQPTEKLLRIICDEVSTNRLGKDLFTASKNHLLRFIAIKKSSPIQQQGLFKNSDATAEAPAPTDEALVRKNR